MKKPEHWDAWVFNFFGTNITNEEFYYIDSDNDGLVNILEYYSIEPLVISTRSKRAIDSIDVTQIGSDPTDPDTDDYWLLNGFKTFYKMSPTKPDDSSADSDNDGISDLQKQIYGTDPMNHDSDGDGTTDGTEVKEQGDPSDISDGGSNEHSSSFATIQLTIRDHSGSHSERYNLHLGGICHQSPGFGLVRSENYKFIPGTYPMSTPNVPEYPCHQCEKWYREELKDLKWLHQMNSELPCPCKAAISSIYTGLTTANLNSDVNWGMDFVCSRNGLPACSSYHPGAYGCIRANWKTHRQRCCYDRNLNWIKSGLPAAGTPYKANFIWDHKAANVEPFNFCCSTCKENKYCDYYRGKGGVRTGPDSCSNTI